MFLLWIFISLCWVAMSNKSLGYIPYWIIGEFEIDSYSEFILSHTRHPSLLFYPTVALSTSVVIGCALVYKARMWWLLLFISPLFLCSWIGTGWGGSWTELTHLDTIESGDYVYHLTFGEDGGGHIAEEIWLVFFSCDKPGEVCNGVYVAVGEDAQLDSKLQMDMETNELHVLTDGTIVMTFIEECLQIERPFKLNFPRDVANCEGMR